MLKVGCVCLKFCHKSFCNWHVTWAFLFSVSGYLERSSSLTDTLKPKLSSLTDPLKSRSSSLTDPLKPSSSSLTNPLGLLPDALKDEGDGEDVRDPEDDGSESDDNVGGDDRDGENGDGGDESGEGDEEDGIGGKMEAGFLDREQLKTIMAQQDPELLRSVGHQFEDFVVYCTYRGVNCA